MTACTHFIIHVWELTGTSLHFSLFDRLWREECLSHLIWIALLWESQRFPPGSHLHSSLAFLHLYLLVSYVSIWKSCRNKFPFIVLNFINNTCYWLLMCFDGSDMCTFQWSFWFTHGSCCVRKLLLGYWKLLNFDQKSDHETMPDFVVYLFFKTKARWWFLLALGIVRVIVFKYKSVFVFCFLHAFLHLSFKVTATFFIPSNLPKVNATYLFHASVKSTSVFLYWGFNSLFWTTEQVGERSTSKNFLFKIYHRGYRK